jgi:hypothetical protein
MKTGERHCYFCVGKINVYADLSRSCRVRHGQFRSNAAEFKKYIAEDVGMPHNRKMTAVEARTVREFALFIRLAAQTNDLQASIYQRALLEAQMDLTAALIDVVKPVIDAAKPKYRTKQNRKRR